jgi:hypothetical protein
VQSKFSLANYLGQRVQIRWIAQGWEFDPLGASQDYQSYGRGWENNPHDDGWWVDDIRITGAIESQATPVPDAKTAPVSTCPVGAGARCDEAGGGDNGYSVMLVVHDAGNGNNVFEKGEPIEVDASSTTNPGGCVDGVTEFQFLRNGVVVQDYSANAVLKEAATATSTYTVKARCSSDRTCTTATGVIQTVNVYSGDPRSIALTITHNRTTNTTTVSFPAQAPPPPPMTGGYDLIRGTRTDDGLPTTASAPDLTLGTAIVVSCNVGVGVAVGQPIVYNTTDPPALNSAHYYLAGYHAAGPGAKTAFGVRSDGTTQSLAITCP